MGKASVLCLEDEPTARAELAEFIRHHNYPVVTAGTGEEALKIAQTQKIGILLADIRMPGRDGIDIACEIQRIQPNTMVTFVTAYSDDPQYRQRVRDCDLKVSAWISKPLVTRARRHVLGIVKHATDLSLMRDVVRIWKERGWSDIDALGAAEAIAPTLEISEDTRKAFREETIPPDSPEQVISDLLQATGRTRASLDVVEERQLWFENVKEIALSRLREVYKHSDQDTRRMALLIRMAVRQMRGLVLTSEQLDALEYAVTKLASGDVGPSDRRDCRRRFRLSGVETMITLGPRTEELIKIYDEYDDGQGQP